MKVKKAGIFDFLKTRKIIVDDRSMFDNPIFTRGIPPAYPTWSGLKSFIKYFYTVLNPRSKILFLEDDGNILGVAIVVNKNFVDGFFINKEFRGMGAGKFLMQETLKVISKLSGDIEIGVQVKNERAKRFYEAGGFKLKEYILRKKLR